MKINELPAPIGSRKRRKKVGRGESSGHGKTSGKGNKGARARSGHGNLRVGFEGGQMPLIRRIPKRGFNNKFKKEFQIVNIGTLDSFKENDTIAPENLLSKGVIRSSSVPVKVLGDGKLTKPLVVKAHAFSKSAKAAIEKLGGKTELLKV